MTFARFLFALLLITSANSSLANSSSSSSFAAPTYTDRTKIVNPEIGAIILDKGDDKFYGNIDGTASGWVSFTPEDEPIISCWTDYTPTWSTTDVGNPPTLGTGTVSGKWRRVGDTMELKVYFNTNGVTSFGLGEWLFEMPIDSGTSAAYEVDQNKVITDSNSDSFIGTAQMKEADGNYYTYNAIINDPLNSSQIRIKGATGTVNGSFPFTWQNDANDTLSIKATIPILGWKTTTPTMSLNCP